MEFWESTELHRQLPTNEIVTWRKSAPRPKSCPSICTSRNSASAEVTGRALIEYDPNHNGRKSERLIMGSAGGRRADGETLQDHCGRLRWHDGSSHIRTTAARDDGRRRECHTQGVSHEFAHASTRFNMASGRLVTVTNSRPPGSNPKSIPH